LTRKIHSVISLIPPKNFTEGEKIQNSASIFGVSPLWITLV